MAAPNLFAESSPPERDEHFETLARLRNVRIVKIVSSALAEPKRFEQEEDEWVVLLRGQAKIELGGVVHQLAAGDYLTLPAGVPHTVLATSQGALWLAVHVGAAS